MTEMTPATLEELQEMIAAALADNTPLEVIGRGTKCCIGGPVAASTQLSTRALKGIDQYEPEELVLSAGAGTPLAEIEATLGESGQMLAFEPPHLTKLMGVSGQPTLGGALAVAIAGPRRFVAGGMRDFLLGFNAVNGRGEIFKSGGRVVKNVTGFDLSKLMCGSFGTLAVMSRVTLKVLPKPEVSPTLVIRGLTEGEGLQVLRDAWSSPYSPSGLAFVPADVGIQSMAGEDASMTLIRFEGLQNSVVERASLLGQTLGGVGALEVLEDELSRALWRDVQEVSCFVEPADTPVWQIGVPPTQAAALASALRAAIGGRILFDWAGANLWYQVATTEAQAQQIQGIAGEHKAKATLVRGDEALRRSPWWHPIHDPAVTGLQERIRESFDPRRILNPGRRGGEV